MTDSTLKVALFSPDKQIPPSTFIEAHRQGVLGNVSYFYDGWCPTRLEGHGLLVNYFQLAYYFFRDKLLKNPLSYKQQAINHYLAHNHFDVAFAEFGITGAKILPLCQQNNTPLVVIFHGADAYDKRQADLFAHDYPRLFAYASTIIVVSQHMRSRLLQLGCPEEKLAWTPCAPHERFFEIKNQCTSKKFVAVGRFTAKKSPMSTIKAFAEMHKKHTDAELFLGGDGDLLPVCQELVQSLGLEKAIHFLGNISPEAVKAEFSTALAFVQHSITSEDGDTEGTPVAVLEASAASLPVVSTLHAGIPDVVKHNETGFLVPENDIQGMAEAMSRLADDRDLAREMGEKGRDFVCQNFSMAHHLNIINTALAKAAGK